MKRVLLGILALALLAGCSGDVSQQQADDRVSQMRAAQQRPEEADSQE